MSRYDPPRCDASAVAVARSGDAAPWPGGGKMDDDINDRSEFGFGAPNAPGHTDIVASKFRAR